MLSLTGCICEAHALLVSLAAAGDASQMGDFFKKVYEQLLGLGYYRNGKPVEAPPVALASAFPGSRCCQ